MCEIVTAGVQSLVLSGVWNCPYFPFRSLEFWHFATWLMISRKASFFVLIVIEHHPLIALFGVLKLPRRVVTKQGARVYVDETRIVLLLL